MSILPLIVKIVRTLRIAGVGLVNAIGQVQGSLQHGFNKSSNSSNSIYNGEILGSKSNESDWIDLDKETLDQFTERYFSPCNCAPYASNFANKEQLNYAAGYVLENTWHQFMSKSPTYIPNDLNLNILGVEPDGFGSGVAINSLKNVRLEALTNWYEVKASGKSSLPVSYAQIRQELNAMRQVYSGLKGIGYTINYTLVTTSNVLLSETRSSIINTAKNYGIQFSHITPKYQIRNGEVYVKFVAKHLPSGAESILDFYKPVKLQSHNKNLKCPCEK